MISNLINMSKAVHNYIQKKSNKYIKRNRKINIYDTVLFRLLLSKNGNTQDIVTENINDYKKKNKCCRRSYVDKENKLDMNFYKGFYLIW